MSEYIINVINPSSYGITLVSEQGPAGSLPQIANSRILGNISGVTANAYGLTNSQVKTFLAITSSDVSGVQPLIAAGTINDYWRGDKTWVTLNQASVAGLTTSDSPVFAGATFSGASLVSTPALSLTGAIYSGGTATTTKPHVLIEPSGTTSTAWSTAGTGIGVNAASGFTGNLIDLKTAGTSRITISATGDINAWSSNVSQRFGSNFYFYNASFNSTSGCTINAGGSGNANIELNTGGAAVSVVMKPKAGQTGDILQIQDASAAVLCKVDITGGITATTGTFTGQILGPTGTSSAPAISFSGDPDTGMYNLGNAIAFTCGGAVSASFASNSFNMASGHIFGFSSGNPAAVSADTILRRDAANILAQRNSTNAQTLRVYGSYTDASTYSRASLSCSTTALTLAFESNTGNGNIQLSPKGTGYVSIMNGANYTHIQKASGASGRLHILWPDETYSAVSFGGGNDELYIRDGRGMITHSGATFSITARSSSDMQITVDSSAQMLIGNASGNLAFNTAGACAFSKAIGLASYTVAGVPAATTAGQIIYVSNESGGAVPAFSDGTNWRRVTDRAIVS